MRHVALVLLPLLTTLAWADGGSPPEPLDAAAVLESTEQVTTVEQQAEAIERLRDATLRWPDQAVLHARLGRLLYAAAAHGEAAQAFARAAQLGDLDAEGHVYHGHCHVALGATEAARAAYVAGLVAHPESEAPIRGGLLHLAGGDWANVEPLLREAIEVTYLSCAAWHMLGVSLVQQARWDEAADALARAVDLGAPGADALDLLGWAEEQCGRGEAAYAAYREALRVDPDAEHAATRMDALLQGAKKPIQELRYEYEDLLELAPRNPWIRNNYAYQLRQSAERMWAMMPAMETEVTRWMLKRSGEVYTEVAAMRPDDPQLQSDTGLLFEYYPCVRDDEKARKYFTRALELTGWVYRDALNGMIRMCDRNEDWATLHEVTAKALAAFDEGAPAVVPAGATGAPTRMEARKTLVVRRGVELAQQAAEAHLVGDSALRHVPPPDLDLVASFEGLPLPAGWQIDRPDSAPQGDAVSLAYRFDAGTLYGLKFRHRGTTKVMGKESRHDFETMRWITPTGSVNASEDQPARIRFQVTALGQTTEREYEAHIAPDGCLPPETICTVPEARQPFADICKPLYTTLLPLPGRPVRIGESWEVRVEPMIVATSRVGLERATMHAEAYQTLVGFEDVDGARCARIEMTYLAAARSDAFVLRAGGASPGELAIRGTAVILLDEAGWIRRAEHDQEQHLEVRDAMQPLALTIEEHDGMTITGSIER